MRFLALFHITLFSVHVLIVREEEVGRSETHEMATFQPYTSSLTSLPSGQDVVNVAQPIGSQAQSEGVTSTHVP